MRKDPDLDYETSPINSALIEARVLADMSVGELAERAGFTSSFITYYERFAARPNPTVKTMYKYARALGMEFKVDENGLHITDAAGGTYLANFTEFDREDDDA